MSSDFSLLSTVREPRHLQSHLQKKQGVLVHSVCCIALWIHMNLAAGALHVANPSVIPGSRAGRAF